MKSLGESLLAWVLSLPKRLRPFLYRDPVRAGAVLAILLRAIRSVLVRTSPGAPVDAQLGAVSFLQLLDQPADRQVIAR